MDEERINVTTTIEASPDAVFEVLADPTTHAAIDGTGWVRESLDGARLTETGQTFRMAMYHENHPDKDYEMENEVVVFDPPRTIAWKPGQRSSETGELEFGGWVWRYDLEATGASGTTVTLSYDWSAVPPPIREEIPFPPFGQRPPRALAGAPRRARAVVADLDVRALGQHVDRAPLGPVDQAGDGLAHLDPHLRLQRLGDAEDVVEEPQRVVAAAGPRLDGEAERHRRRGRRCGTR